MREWPPGVKAVGRRFSRLRWLRKRSVVAERTGNAGFWAGVRYTVWDPELDTFSYDLANEAELACGLAAALSVTSGDVEKAFAELRNDTALRAQIRAASRWDPGLKWSPGLGRHAVPYAIARVRKPRVAAEVGIRHGLGSLVLLSAMRRNAAEGAPGMLVGVDIDPAAGVLVRRARAHDATTGGPWQFVHGPSPDVLDALPGDVGFVILDSVPQPEVTRAEVRWALSDAAPPAVILQSGWNTVLPEACHAASVACTRLVDKPVEHVGAGRQSFVASADRDAIERLLVVLGDGDHSPTAPH